MKAQNSDNASSHLNNHAEYLKAKVLAQTSSSNFDCIIPVSGGKDSVFAIKVALKAGLTPLAFTMTPISPTSRGASMLNKLKQLGLSHLQLTPNPIVERLFLRKSLELFGNPTIPMHLAIKSAPINIAVKLQIPFVVFTEDVSLRSTEPSSGICEIDDSYIRNFGGTSGTVFSDWLEEVKGLKSQSLFYELPDPEFIRRSGVQLVCLETRELAWEPHSRLHVAQEVWGLDLNSDESYGNWIDLDDDLMQLNDYFKWIKFGHLKAMEITSNQIRSNLCTRQEGLQLITRAYADALESNPLPRLAARLHIPLEELTMYASEHRNRDLWEQAGGIWVIPQMDIGIARLREEATLAPEAKSSLGSD